MTDVFSKEKRSWIMSRVKGKNTTPEMAVRKFLHKEGFRFRLHDKKLPGTPHIILPKYKTAIYVHGCFWHGHDNCKKAALPKTQTDFWSRKIHTNRCNDEKNSSVLKGKGWHVLTVWQCELKPIIKDYTLQSLKESILKGGSGS